MVCRPTETFKDIAGMDEELDVSFDVDLLIFSDSSGVQKFLFFCGGSLRNWI
jgi:hypothetical protein